MADTVSLRTQLRQTIDDEIVARQLVHKQRIARLRIGTSNIAAFAAPASPRPLVLLAHGDSWFDYPLTGNGLPLSDSDVIAQLRRMGSIIPVILNLSHHGDAATDEMSLPKQQRLIDALTDPQNWLENGKPDAILISAGGNDIAGDQFCIFLDYAIPGSTGLNTTRFEEALGMVEACYRDLFAFRDRYAAGVPIIGHCYDFPIPNGSHPICAGPWLKPSLDYCGWIDVAQGTSIVRAALLQFRELLVKLAKEATNNFIIVETQGTLSPNEWANELHAYPEGFKKIAVRFLEALRTKFPGRI